MTQSIRAMITGLLLKTAQSSFDKARVHPTNPHVVTMVPPSEKSRPYWVILS